MGQLDGRVAIVTGASRGIGKEIALLFAREGARVVAAARTEHEGDHQLPGGIAETVAQARDSGGEATAVRADISQLADIEHLIAATHEAYGPVDVLVNNAALTYYIPIADFPLKRWQRMLDVDLTAPFLLAQAVIPDMLAAGRGNIVNISSLAARHPEGPPYAMPGRGGTTYGVVKAGIERFTTGLAHELFDQQIAVNSLAPAGIVASPGVMFHRLIESEDDPRAEPVEYMAPRRANPRHLRRQRADRPHLLQPAAAQEARPTVDEEPRTQNPEPLKASIKPVLGSGFYLVLSTKLNPVSTATRA